jgi:L-arabinose transport system ATP-binding protein
MTQEAAPPLQMEAVTVRFPGVLALDRASLEVRAGEVHGLMGENGAGKSTILKVLSGVHRPDAGRIRLDGEVRDFADPRAALVAGIAVIHQELHLVPELTVAENLLLGHFPNRHGVIDRRALVARAREELRRLGEDIDPTQKVKSLAIGQRQMVEIGKALSRDARVIAFDEPTSSLSMRETEHLMAIIAALKHQGRAIIYVSHRLDEVYSICDRVTVFRDGRRVTSFDMMPDLDRAALVQAMVGRPIQDVYGYRPRTVGPVTLDVKGVAGRGLNKPASFEARSGEILGFFGLVGAGRTELLKLIYGAEPRTAGEIRLNGATLLCTSPRASVAAGIALCPEDRKHEGILPIASVADNLNLSCRRHQARWGLVLDRRRERRTAREYIDKLGIKTPDADTPIGLLSGGNQQKVILARWLAEHSEVLLMDEPTRGIDVGARSELYRLLYSLAESGKTIIVVSSDLAEVIGVSDRIIVMREGAIVGELGRAQATPERLIDMALPRA